LKNEEDKKKLGVFHHLHMDWNVKTVQAADIIGGWLYPETITKFNESKTKSFIYSIGDRSSSRNSISKKEESTKVSKMTKTFKLNKKVGIPPIKQELGDLKYLNGYNLKEKVTWQ
jgi:hypothetical protein